MDIGCQKINEVKMIRKDLVFIDEVYKYDIELIEIRQENLNMSMTYKVNEIVDMNAYYIQ